jgi:CheY-like chemotaxis protein
MALGALIAAQGEDDGGALHALLPLAGRTLVEYQARCAAAVGAAPIVVLVDRVPPALQAAFERLRGDGISVIPVSDAAEAAARFEPGLSVLQIADGVAPTPALLAELAEQNDRSVATVADAQGHEAFERIDDRHRWAGVARVDSSLLADTARMIGDWDLQSTLLRRTVQAGARWTRA